MRKNKPLILGMAVLLAIITAITAATFAWFTSQDTVTNHIETAKLTDGDVSIIETFDPSDKLEPGVAVNKQVGAINTGEADALVRMSFAEALTKLATGEQVRNAAKYSGAATEIPELVNIDAYQGWNVLSASSFTLTADSAAFSALPAGITVMYKQTATAPEAKYSFAAYAALGTTPETYQRVEVLPEAFNMVDGKLKITLQSTDATPVSYFNFITLTLAAKQENKWANFTGTGTLQTLPDTRTFTALTSEPSTILSPNIATPSLSSQYIQLIFGNNVSTNLATAVDGQWYYNANDGWFYYLGTLKSGESTGNLLEKIYMNQAAGKEYSYTEFDLTVKMDGIQAVKDAVTSASGWNLIGVNAALASKLQTYAN